MITEDYVSFEVAKLLKEKGFDEWCNLHYHYNEAFDKWFQTSEFIDNRFKKYYYPCPTLQMAMKWLRDNKGFYIAVVPACHEKVLFVEIYKFEFGEWNPLSEDDTSLVYTRNESVYNKEYERPEEAYDESIKYCLENLI